MSHLCWQIQQINYSSTISIVSILEVIHYLRSLRNAILNVRDLKTEGGCLVTYSTKKFRPRIRADPRNAESCGSGTEIFRAEKALRKFSALFRAENAETWKRGSAKIHRQGPIIQYISCLSFLWTQVYYK